MILLIFYPVHNNKSMCNLIIATYKMQRRRIENNGINFVHLRNYVKSRMTL